jgi:hypothetical protein
LVCCTKKNLAALFPKMPLKSYLNRHQQSDAACSGYFYLLLRFSSNSNLPKSKNSDRKTADRLLGSNNLQTFVLYVENYFFSLPMYVTQT